MKVLAGLILLMLFSSGCKWENHDINKNELIKYNEKQDSLVSIIMAKGIKSFVSSSAMEMDPEISFDSKIEDSIGIYIYDIRYKEGSLKLVSKNFEQTIRSTYFDQISAPGKTYCESPDCMIAQMDIGITYEDSEYYTISNSSLYMIVSWPMRWSGLMNQFSFVQLIDYRNKEVKEFVAEYNKHKQ